MRILVVRGRNLASISGDFEVPFDREPLLGAGLFAITGPTGSGKSTLLDAMCLALFDRIPRLRLASNRSKVTGGPEDEEVSATDTRGVLRRGAGEGYAEVEFADNHHQRYRARWTARRARGRADGRLQPVEMALWGPDGSALSGGRKAEVLADIETRLGLGFEQFRRSALLAQGEFAAFLHADPTERANVLERITGTEIYAHLSMAAHARATAAALDLQRVNDRLLMTGVLDAAVRQEAEARCSALRAEEVEVRLARDQAQAALDWHRRHEDLVRARADALTTRDRLAAEHLDQADAYARDRAQELLEHARPALVAADGAAAARVAAEGVEANRAADYQAARDHADRANAAAADARAHHNERVQTFAARDAEIAQAAGLDAAVDAAQAAADHRTSERVSAASQLQRAEEALFGLQQAVQAASAERMAAARALAEVAADAGWVADMGALDLALSRLEASAKAATAAAAAADVADQKAGLARQAAIEAEEAARHADAAAATAAGVLATAAASRAGLPDLGPRESAYERRRALVARAREIAASWAADRRVVSEAEVQASADEALAQSAATRGIDAERLLPSYRARVEEARAAATRLREALSLEDRRSSLVDGQPCPLCGSEHHPWATGSGPVPSALVAQEARVHELVAEAERVAKEGMDAAQQAALARQRAQAARRRAGEAAGRVEDAEGRWAALWAEEPALGATPADPAALHAAVVDEGAALHEARAHRSAPPAAFSAASVADHQAREVASARAIDARTARDTAAQAEVLQATRRAQAQATRDAEVADRAEAGRLAPAGTDLQEPALALSHLAARAKRFRERTEAAATAERVEQAREADVREAAAAASGAREVLAQATALAAAAAHAVAQARDARAAVLGGLPTSAARAALDSARRGAEEALRAAESAAAGRAAAADSALQVWERASQDRIRATAEAHRAAEAWRAAWAGRAVDEPSARALLARPAEELRASLAAHHAREADLRDAGTLLRERERNLDQHRADDEPPEKAEVEQAMDEILRHLHEIGVEAARLEASLRVDDEARRAAASLTDERDGLQRTYDVWRALNELIGSQDGRKFKRFAQGLTLDALLVNANRHLQQLAPRYTLLRVPGSELDLQVLDRDLADEVRAVYSLSGGETFLVSLALALGLAALSAADTPVESLFIDEGFGTLDPETLESALAVLETLQAGGRQVGIISHVSGLAERVGAQIRVVPTGAGRSRIEVV